MKIRRLGATQTEITTAAGVRVLVSYDTPVAVITPAGNAMRTRRFYSRTTFAHITKWLGPELAQRAAMVEPELIAGALEGKTIEGGD